MQKVTLEEYKDAPVGSIFWGNNTKTYIHVKLEKERVHEDYLDWHCLYDYDRLNDAPVQAYHEFYYMNEEEKQQYLTTAVIDRFNEVDKTVFPVTPSIKLTLTVKFK